MNTVFTQRSVRYCAKEMSNEERMEVTFKNYSTGKVEMFFGLKEIVHRFKTTKFIGSQYGSSRKPFLFEDELYLGLRDEAFPHLSQEVVSEIIERLKTGFRVNEIDEIVRFGYILNQSDSYYHATHIETGIKRLFPTEALMMAGIGFEGQKIDRYRTGFNESSHIQFNGYDIQFRPENQPLHSELRKRKPIASVWDLATWSN